MELERVYIVTADVNIVHVSSLTGDLTNCTDSPVHGDSESVLLSKPLPTTQLQCLSTAGCTSHMFYFPVLWTEIDLNSSG